MNEKIKELVARIDKVTEKIREDKRATNDELCKIRNDILKLEKESESCQDSNETWMMLREIAKMSWEAQDHIFNYVSVDDIITNITLDEVRERYLAYKEEQKKEQGETYVPKRGDRVNLINKHSGAILDAIFVTEYDTFNMVLLDDSVYTGRYYKRDWLALKKGE